MHVYVCARVCPYSMTSCGELCFGSCEIAPLNMQHVCVCDFAQMNAVSVSSERFMLMVTNGL